MLEDRPEKLWSLKALVHSRPERTEHDGEKGVRRKKIDLFGPIDLLLGPSAPTARPRLQLANTLIHTVFVHSRLKDWRVDNGINSCSIKNTQQFSSNFDRDDPQVPTVYAVLYHSSFHYIYPAIFQRLSQNLCSVSRSPNGNH
jgi:hypothetical protein